MFYSKPLRTSVPGVYDLAHVAEWEPYNLHDLTHLGWSCTVQIL